MNVDVSGQLRRAEVAVESAKKTFDASAKRRNQLKDDDCFLERMMREAANVHKERSSGLPLRSAAVSNLSRIDEILGHKVVGTAKDRKISSFFDEEPEFVVDSCEQRAVQAPSGIWVTKEILNQKEYDVDANNNQEAEEDGITVPLASERSATPLVLVDTREAPTLSVPQESSNGNNPDRTNSVSHELSTLFNRLLSNDGVFVFPEIDDYNSTQFSTTFTAQPKQLSLGHGNLLRRFFDSPQESNVMYSTRRWCVRRNLMEKILQGQFDVEHVTDLQLSIESIRAIVDRERSLRMSCERSLSFEIRKTRRLTSQLRTIMERNRERQRNVLVAAVKIDIATSYLDAGTIPVLKQTLADGHDSRSEQISFFEEIRLVLARMGSLREERIEDNAVDDRPYPFLDDHRIRQRLLEQFSITDKHIASLDEFDARERRKAERKRIEGRFEAMENTTMELEDSHSGYNQLFVVGDNVYSRMGSIARILTPEQQRTVFGQDIALIQFYELTKSRNSICPLCRFEFDSTKPLTAFAEIIEEKTKKVTEQLHVMVGRRHASRGGGAGTDCDLGGTMRSASSGRRNSRNTITTAPQTLRSRPPTPQMPDPSMDTLGEFETQVAIMALQQMNKDLEAKVCAMQEKIDEATAAIRLEKMHYSTLDSKYKETIRETGDYRRKFDSELKRSTELTEMFREQAVELQQELNRRQCQIDDLQEVNDELTAKMERNLHAEKQINTLRFGFPVAPDQKADLSFQEIGYVYFRKFHECKMQLLALKKRFRLADSDFETRDVGVGKEAPGFSNVKEMSTYCIARDLTRMIDRGQATETRLGTESASQTDPVRALMEAADPIATDDRISQTDPFTPSFEFKCCKYSDLTPPLGSQQLMNFAWNDIAPWVLNENEARSFFDLIEKRRIEECQALADISLSAALASKQSEITKLLDEHRAVTLMHTNELKKVLKEKQNVISAYNVLLAKVNEEANAVSLKIDTYDQPSSGVDDLRLAEDRCTSSEQRERAAPNEYELLRQRIQSKPACSRKSHGIDGVVAHERALRNALQRESGYLAVPIQNVAEIIASLQRELRNCKCRKSVFCSVVNVALDVLPRSKTLLAPIPRDSCAKEHHGTVSLNTPGPVDDVAEERRALQIRSFIFDDLVGGGGEAVANVTTSTLPVPPLPALSSSPDALRTDGRRFVSVDRQTNLSSRSALIIKSIASRLALRKIRGAMQSREASDLSRNVLEALFARESERLETFETARQREGIGLSTFGPENVGLMAQSGASLMQLQSHVVAPQRRIHHTNPTLQRSQAALLAVRIQAQQRLGTPSNGLSTEADARMFGPLGPTRFGEAAIEQSIVPSQELHMTSFLPRPLPIFRGAIPPCTITGTASDSVVKKPAGGFGGGWHDPGAAKRMNAVVASRITKTIVASRAATEGRSSEHVE